MSRPIKFRAWDGMRITYSGIMFNTSEGILFSAAKMPLMQFTGLHDKNGKEIFEGDIIRWKDCDEYSGVSKVVWNVGGANFEMSPNHGGFDYEPTLGSCFESGEMEVEIIGNIYENPELLK